MKDHEQAAGGGIGFLGLLAIAFIVLKILGKITWSWWWVLAPLWIAPVVVVVFLILVLVVVLVALYFEED